MRGSIAEFTRNYEYTKEYEQTLVLLFIFKRKVRNNILTKLFECDIIYATDCTEVKKMSKMTIYKLAQQLNMSPSMVSRAFNPDAKIKEEKRKLILSEAKKYGFFPNTFASRLSMDPIKIGIIINSRYSVNTDKMIAGVNLAYEELRDYKVDHNIIVLDPNESSENDYERAFEGVADCGGVILAGFGSQKYTHLINKLHAKNPNIAQVQAINTEAEYLFASKYDESVASRLAAEFLYNCLRKSERKNILLFTGDVENTLHASSRDVFCQACEGFGLNVISQVDTKDSTEYLKNNIARIYEEYGGQTDGIYITSGASAPLCEFLWEREADVALVTVDTHNEIMTYLEKGVISATISQNVKEQMRKAFRTMVRHIINGEKPPRTVFTNVRIVMRGNMDAYKE